MIFFIPLVASGGSAHRRAVPQQDPGSGEHSQFAMENRHL